MRRRTLLQRAAAGAGLTVAASLPYGLARLLAPPVEAAPSRTLRPPGAIRDEAGFVAACIGCGLCGEVCPPQCIRFFKREAGNAVNTPYIDPEDRACILCDKCMEICPTPALSEMPREQIDMGIARIDRMACYPWVDRGICGACVSVCPVGEQAIGYQMWNQYRPVVKQGCVGCGMCVEVCPHPSLPIQIVDRAAATPQETRS